MRLKFIPFEKLLKQYKLLDIETRDRNHEFIRVCKECRADNEEKERKWYLELCRRGYYDIDDVAVQRAKNKRALYIENFIKLWKFHPERIIDNNPKDSFELTNT
jgi:hypothetical protein